MPTAGYRLWRRLTVDFGLTQPHREAADRLAHPLADSTRLPRGATGPKSLSLNWIVFEIVLCSSAGHLDMRTSWEIHIDGMGATHVVSQVFVYCIWMQ